MRKHTNKRSNMWFRKGLKDGGAGASRASGVPKGCLKFYKLGYYLGWAERNNSCQDMGAA